MADQIRQRIAPDTDSKTYEQANKMLAVAGDVILLGTPKTS